MNLQSQLAWDALGTAIQLNRLDRGLRESVVVQKQQLRASSDLARCNAEILGVQKQLKELAAEANELHKHQLQAQRQQLEIQLQSLQLQMQQHERNVLKEEREAQENAILKVYVDLYSLAQSQKQQSRFLDYLITVLGAFRVYQQIYSDLDDANNRLKVTDLKDRLYADLGGIVKNERVQHALTEAYRDALSDPAHLLSRLSDASQSIGDIETTLSLAQAAVTTEARTQLGAVGATIVSLQASVSELRQAFTAATAKVPPAELFFPAAPERVAVLVSGLDAGWNSWCERAAMAHGRNILDFRTQYESFPASIQSIDSRVADSATAFSLLSEAVSLVATAEILVGILPKLNARLAEIESAFRALPTEVEATPLAFAANRAALARVELDAKSAFGTFSTVLVNSKHAASPKWQSASQKKVNDAKRVGPRIDHTVRDAFELGTRITSLFDSVAKLAKRYDKSLVTIASGADSFGQLESELRQGLDSTQLSRVDSSVAAYRPGCLARLVGVFKSAKGKEVDRRRVVANALATEKARSMPELPELADVNSGCAAIELPKHTT